MAKTKKFPHMIYVKLGNEGEDDEYLDAYELAKDALEVGETVTIATYELRTVAKGRLEPRFSK